MPDLQWRTTIISALCVSNYRIWSDIINKVLLITRYRWYFFVKGWQRIVSFNPHLLRIGFFRTIFNIFDLLTDEVFYRSALGLSLSA